MVDDEHIGRPHFMAGDPMAVPEFSFRHEMNIVEVHAIFTQEDGEHHIVLAGTPTVEGPPHELATASGPRLFRFSHVSLEGIVSGQDPPGEYICAGLTAFSASGNEISFEDIPNLSFVVALEPSRRPIITGTISLGWLQVHFHAGVYDTERDEHIRPIWDRDSGKFVDPE